MLIIARSLRDLDFSRLKDVYTESIREQGSIYYRREPENIRLILAEQEFYRFLREDFFRQKGALFAIWEEKGEYVSALRLQPYRDGYLLEGLETAPGHRRKGYGEALVTASVSVLKQMGCSAVYAHVRRNNLASRRLHQMCGFRAAEDYAVLADGTVTREYDTFVCHPD